MTLLSLRHHYIFLTLIHYIPQVLKNVPLQKHFVCNLISYKKSKPSLWLYVVPCSRLLQIIQATSIQTLVLSEMLYSYDGMLN